MLQHKPEWRPVTVGADRAYDTKDFVAQWRDMNITSHVAQNATHRSSAIDGRTTRHPGYVRERKRRSSCSPNPKDDSGQKSQQQRANGDISQMSQTFPVSGSSAILPAQSKSLLGP
jgi:hypothetical protein